MNLFDDDANDSLCVLVNVLKQSQTSFTPITEITKKNFIVWNFLLVMFSLHTEVYSQFIQVVVLHLIFCFCCVRSLPFNIPPSLTVIIKQLQPIFFCFLSFKRIDVYFLWDAFYVEKPKIEWNMTLWIGKHQKLDKANWTEKKC